jgi:cyclic lactone autoinducer peptide
MADIVYRMAEKSVDEASAWYEYQPEVPEKLKKRNSCKFNLFAWNLIT